MARKSALAIAADLLDPPDDTWRPHPHQIPPAGKWFVWLMNAGRGAGKTETASRYMHEHVNGPPCIKGVPGGHWPAIIAPTLGDGVTSCVNGPSGIRKFDPDAKVRVTPGGTIVKHGNGVETKIFGAHSPEDVERLRSGGNRCVVWAEELAAWRYLDECWQHMRYGLRVGPWPHVIASTTPKNRTLIKKLVTAARSGEETEELGRVVMTTATTDDNPDLPEHVKRMLFADYGGTRLGRQELYAEILEDVEGALWTPTMIDLPRLTVFNLPKHFDKISVGVDPPAKTTGDECGIVVAGKITKYMAPSEELSSKLPHGFVLADYSIQGSPETWRQQVLRAYREWNANDVVAETNNGGDMVKSHIHTADPAIPVREVHATRGKALRAEPIVGMYEQGRVHHVGYFPLMEDQMTGWDKDDPPDDWSPDRMDGLVWVLWHLMVGSGEMRQSSMRDERLRGRR